MAPSGVVQFREDQESLDFLRQRGINPNEFGREAFERALRRLYATEAIEALSKLKVRLDRPVEDIVREERDRR